MAIAKTGIITPGVITECGLANGYNWFDLTGFSNYNSGTISGPSSNQYTIVSSVITSTWGAGFNITSGSLIVPYGAIYRISMEVYVPSQHSIVVDINNTVPSGATIQGGNDNDTNRTSQSSWTIPANTWTKIWWGSQNLHSKNTTQADICVYDGIGLVTSGDSASVTWYMRNPRAFVGWNEGTTFGIGNGKMLATEIYEY